MRTARGCNEWHLIVATFDGSARKIYFDGQEIGNDLPGSTHLTTSVNLNVGRIGSSNYFQGFISEISVWNTRLREAGIMDLMQYGITSSSQNLVGFWKFRTNSTNGLFSNSVQDLSVNNNSLTMFGFNFSNWKYTLAPSFQEVPSSVVQVNVIAMILQCQALGVLPVMLVSTRTKSLTKDLHASLCKLGKYQNSHNGSSRNFYLDDGNKLRVKSVNFQGTESPIISIQYFVVDSGNMRYPVFSTNMVQKFTLRFPSCAARKSFSIDEPLTQSTFEIPEYAALRYKVASGIPF